ncbi:MAG: short-chain dehydrogenase [Gammaproteobacteria bacterium]|nr:MAG: short-chain dehydrogenase [Gammaproteobacteria bacterium]
MKNWIIVGACSAIAEATARVLAARGCKLFLLARNQEKLDVVAQDLKVRGAAEVFTQTFDACDHASHSAMFSDAEARLGKVDGIFIAHGTLPDQKACEADFDLAKKEFDVNGLSVMSLVSVAANFFESKQEGTIAVITSVAGDRGRQSNYLYGSAKAAVSTFLAGVRNRLAGSGVHVLTIKPGFVDTPMTAGMDKSGPLWAQPEDVAQSIVKAIDKRRNTVYVPWFWEIIMLVIKSIPEFIFKKLNL